MYVQAAVQALGRYGDSQVQTQGSWAYYSVVPDSPTGLTELETTPESVLLQWLVGQSDGGLPVIDYRIVNVGSGEGVVLAEGISVTLYNLTELDVGIYSLAVESRNENGYSMSSAPVTVYILEPLESPHTPVTLNQGVNVKVLWFDPFS